MRRARWPCVDTWHAADRAWPLLRSGEQAKAGDNIQFDYTLRRANGYFIYATVACGIGCGDGTPEVAQLGKTALIVGLEELLTGMRPGEKRRALIPPALGYARCVESKGRHQPASSQGTDSGLATLVTVARRDGLLPQPPDFGQRRQVSVHSKEPLVFEVRLVKIRK